MRQMRPVLQSWHGGEARRNYVPREVATATYVFVQTRAQNELQIPTVLAHDTHYVSE